MASYTVWECRQRCLAFNALRSSTGADAVVMIVGSDGSDNRGSEVALSYLLHGRSGQNLLLAPFGDEFSDDLVVVLSATRSAVFAPTPQVWEKLNALCCLWPNLDVVLPPSGTVKDEDDYDMAKIRFLVDAIKEHKNVGFLLESADSDVKEIEKWPLVQAYAITELTGTEGFLSLYKSVVNVRVACEKVLFASLDGRALGLLAGGAVGDKKDESALAQLYKSWATALSNKNNRDACEQHYMYGMLNDDEVEEALACFDGDNSFGSRGRPTFGAAENTRFHAPFEHFDAYEAVDPQSHAYFARSVPRLGLYAGAAGGSSSSDFGVDFYSPANDAVQVVRAARHAMAIVDYFGAVFARNPSVNLASGSAGRSFRDAWGAHVTKSKLQHQFPVADVASFVIDISRVDALGFKWDVKGVKDEAVLVTVRVEHETRKVVWGDTFVVMPCVSAGDGERVVKVVALTGPRFPAPVALKAKPAALSAEDANPSGEGASKAKDAKMADTFDKAGGFSRSQMHLEDCFVMLHELGPADEGADGEEDAARNRLVVGGQFVNQASLTLVETLKKEQAEKEKEADAAGKKKSKFEEIMRAQEGSPSRQKVKPKYHIECFLAITKEKRQPIEPITLHFEEGAAAAVGYEVGDRVYAKAYATEGKTKYSFLLGVSSEWCQLLGVKIASTPADESEGGDLVAKIGALTQPIKAADGASTYTVTNSMLPSSFPLKQGETTGDKATFLSIACSAPTDAQWLREWWAKVRGVDSVKVQSVDGDHPDSVTDGEKTVFICDMDSENRLADNAYRVLDMRSLAHWTHAAIHKRHAHLLNHLVSAHCVLFPSSRDLKSRDEWTLITQFTKIIRLINPDCKVLRPYALPSSFEEVQDLFTPFVATPRLQMRPGRGDQSTYSDASSFCVEVPLESTTYVEDDLVNWLRQITVEEAEVVGCSATFQSISFDESKSVAGGSIRYVSVSVAPVFTPVAGAASSSNSNATSTRKVFEGEDAPATAGLLVSVWCSLHGSNGQARAEAIKQRVVEALSDCALTVDPVLYGDQIDVVSNEITPEELRDAAVKYPLPDGWAYDGGGFYIFATGEKTVIHPNIEEIRVEEIKKKRERVVQRNYELKKLRAMHGIMEDRL